MPGLPSIAVLRRTVLAASVLDDIDVTPCDDGVVLPGPPDIHLTWPDVAAAIGTADPESTAARTRVAAMLKLRAWVAAHGERAGAQLRGSVRLLALPVSHALHPGPRWVRERLLGGALDCGIGLVPEGGDGQDAKPLPETVAEAAGLDATQLYRDARAHADAMGRLAVQRLRRDRPIDREGRRSATDSQAVLRPVGGLDVPSLLATAPVREYLATSDGTGLRAVAVPIRTRGWYDLARIDPAFVQAAWSASPRLQRGLPRPLLVTAFEVALGPTGGDVVRLALDDPAVDGSWIHRDVRYR